MKKSSFSVLPLALMLSGCSPAPEPPNTPAWPELQDEPPALVEIEHEPMLARLGSLPTASDKKKAVPEGTA